MKIWTQIPIFKFRNRIKSVAHSSNIEDWKSPQILINSDAKKSDLVQVSTSISCYFGWLNQGLHMEFYGIKFI